MSAALATAPLFALRAGVATDHGKVFESWLHSTEKTAWAHALRGSSPDARRALVAALLARPTAQLVVACAPADPNTILGWAVVEPPTVVHFVWVRSYLREKGIARALVFDRLAEPLRYSTRTVGWARWSSRHAGWSFDPASAMVPR